MIMLMITMIMKANIIRIMKIMLRTFRFRSQKGGEGLLSLRFYDYS